MHRNRGSSDVIKNISMKKDMKMKKNINLKISSIGASCPEGFWNLSLNKSLMRLQPEFRPDITLSMKLHLLNAFQVGTDCMEKGIIECTGLEGTSEGHHPKTSKIFRYCFVDV